MTQAARDAIDASMRRTIRGAMRDGITHHVPRRHTRKAPSPRVTPPCKGNDTLPALAFSWLIPWNHRTFPGMRRGVLAALGHSVTWAGVRNWRCGSRPFPAWAALAVRGAIYSRCTEGMRLVAELDSYLVGLEHAPPRHASGLKRCVRDE